MNSFIEYIPESLNDHRAFVEHMLSIIDTKLQFTKYQTNALISSYVDLLAKSNSLDIVPIVFATTNSEQENEEIFNMIEQYSKTTNLLLLLRTKLVEKNVSLIYDLLSNDRYLRYESKYLENMLENSRS